VCSEEWCPSACPASAADRERLGIRAALRGGGSVEAQLPRWNNGSLHRSEIAPEIVPQCANLCSQAWLFVVSIGGRTGSTTVLNMLDAHPLIELAGENHGQINAALTMWEEAAAHYPAGDSKALARGPVQPLNLLCSLQEWFSSVTAYEPPANDGSVAGANVIRGYKDIEWTPESIELLDLVFPCNRKVFNVREDAAAQEASQAALNHFNNAYSDNETEVSQFARTLYEHDQQTQPWKSFWLPLADSGFNASQFNQLYEWLGEDGCKFTDVIHANAPSTTHAPPHAASAKGHLGGFNNADGTIADAEKLLAGKCSLSSVSTLTP